MRTLVSTIFLGLTAGLIGCGGGGNNNNTPACQAGTVWNGSSCVVSGYNGYPYGTTGYPYSGYPSMSGYNPYSYGSCPYVSPQPYYYNGQMCM